MIRNPTPPPAARSEKAAADTDLGRAAKIKAMRDAYLAGTLDLAVPDETDGLRRLLRDVFSTRGGPG